MANNDNLKKLHSNLSQKWDGFAVDYETFEKDMQDEEKLKKLHSNLSQKWNGFAVDYDTFRSDMGLKKKDFSQQDSETPSKPSSTSGEEIKANLSKAIGSRQEGESVEQYRVRALKAREGEIKRIKSEKDAAKGSEMADELIKTIDNTVVEDTKPVAEEVEDYDTYKADAIKKLQDIQLNLQEQPAIIDQDNQTSGMIPDNINLAVGDNLGTTEINPMIKELYDQGALTLANARKAFKANYIKSNPEIQSKLNSDDEEKVEEAHNEIYNEWIKEPEILSGSERVEGDKLNLEVAPGFNIPIEKMYDSFRKGMDERDFNLNMAQQLSFATDDEAKIMLESEFKNSVESANDISIPEDQDLLSVSGMSKMTGTQAVPIATTMVLSLIPGLQPAAVMYSSLDAAATSYGASFRSSYLQARGEGMNQDEAYKVSKEQAAVARDIGSIEGALGAFTGGAATRFGSRITEKFSSKVLAPLVNSAATGTADMGLDGVAAATGQIINNWSAKSQGLNSGLFDGVADEVLGEIIFSSGMKIPSGVKTVSDYKKYVNALPVKDQQSMFNSILDNKENMEQKVVNDKTKNYLNLKGQEALRNDDSALAARIELNPKEVLIEEKTRLTKISEALKDDKARGEIDKNVEALDLMIKNYIEPAVKDDSEVKMDEVKQEGEAIVPAGKRLFNEPNPETKEISNKYKANNNIDIPEGADIKELDVDRSKTIADAYDNMEHKPNDPEVIEAYNAMAKETLDQHKAISDEGYEFEVYEGEGEPYKNAQEMIDDVKNNKHMYILSTEKDFGEAAITDEQRKQNPLLADSGIKDKNGKPLLVNDIFRGVHDFFGHTERGNGFGAVGEENAWDTHARMFGDKARRAMTTETRGQNSWVNFGSQMRNPDGSIKKKGDEGYLSPKERAFAEQKIGLLPKEFSDIEKKYDKPSETGEIKETTKPKEETTAEPKKPTTQNMATLNVIQEYNPKAPENNMKKAVSKYQEGVELGLDKKESVDMALNEMTSTDWYKEMSSEKQKAFDQDFKKALGEDISTEEKANLSAEDNPFVKKRARTVLKEKIANLSKGAKIGSKVAKEQLKVLQKEVKQYSDAMLGEFNLSKAVRSQLENKIINSTQKNIGKVTESIDKIAEVYAEKDRKKTFNEINSLVNNKKSLLKKVGRKWKGKVPIEIQSYIQNFDIESLRNASREDLKSVLIDLTNTVQEGIEYTKLSERQYKAQKRTIAGKFFENIRATTKNNIDKTVSGEEAVRNELNKRDKSILINGQLISSKSALDEHLKDNDVDFESVVVYNTPSAEVVKQNESKVRKLWGWINPVTAKNNLWNDMLLLIKGSKGLRNTMEDLKADIDKADFNLEENVWNKTKDYLKAVEKIFGKNKSRSLRNLAATSGVNPFEDYRTPPTNSTMINLYNIGKSGNTEVDADGNVSVDKNGVEITDGYNKLLKSGLDADGIKQINDYINGDTKLKEYSDYLLNDFYPSMTGEYESTYEFLTNTKFPEGVYYPRFAESKTGDMIDSGELMDKSSGGANYKDAVAGNLKQRVNSPLGVNTNIGAHEVAMSYINSMERAKQFIPVGEKVNAIFSPANNAEMIKKMGSVDFNNLKDNLAAVITGQDPRAGKSGTFDKVVNSFMAYKIFGSLGGKLASIPKQLTSFTHFSTAKGINPFQWIAGFTPKNSNEAEVALDIFKSDYVKRRMEGKSFDIEVNKVLEDSKMTDVNRAKNLITKVFMYPITLGDIGGVLLGGTPLSIAVYRQEINKGKTHEQAKAIAYERFVTESESAQQSTRASETSHMQKHKVGRLFSAFTTSQTQTTNKLKASIRLLLSKSDLTKSEKIEHLYNVAYYSSANVAFAAVSNGLIQSLWEEMDEEEKDSKEYATIMDNIQSILQGAGFTGVVTNMGINILRDDEWKNDIPLLQATKNIAGSVATTIDKLILQGIPWEDLSDSDKNKIIKAVPTDGAIKQVKNLVKAAEGEKRLDEAFFNWANDEEQKGFKPKNDAIYNYMFGEEQSGRKGRSASRQGR